MAGPTRPMTGRSKTLSGGMDHLITAITIRVESPLSIVARQTRLDHTYHENFSV